MIAQDELSQRRTQAELTERRFHDLVWLATDDKEKAERAAAWLSLEQSYQKTTHQSTKSR
jgi:hypothetical protein